MYLNCSGYVLRAQYARTAIEGAAYCNRSMNRRGVRKLEYLFEPRL